MISTLFRRRQKAPKPQAKPVELHTAVRCEYVYGGVRCSMQRTTHGRFCTFHR